MSLVRSPWTVWGRGNIFPAIEEYTCAAVDGYVHRRDGVTAERSKSSDVEDTEVGANQ